MADKFGMMSEAYFKGKRELLEWATDFLKMDIPKVESLCTGAHYCQLCDAMFPNSMKMQKVNFSARTEPEYVKNWKLVQVVFGRQGIQKVIPVERLIKGRFQDNLEFLQWFYQYFMSVYHGGDYDAEGRRKRAKGNSGVRYGGGAASTRKPTAAPRIRQTGERRAPSGSGYGAQRSKKARTDGPSRVPASRDNNAGGASTAELEELREKLRIAEEERGKLELEQQTWTAKHKELETCARAIEQERDFYFQKVVEVEEVCKALPAEQAEADHVKAIIKILYSGDDDSPRSNNGGVEGAADVEMEGEN